VYFRIFQIYRKMSLRPNDASQSIPTVPTVRPRREMQVNQTKIPTLFCTVLYSYEGMNEYDCLYPIFDLNGNLLVQGELNYIGFAEICWFRWELTPGHSLG